MNSTVSRHLISMVKKVLTCDSVTTYIAERTMRILIVVVINDIMGRRRVYASSTWGCLFFFFLRIEFDDFGGFLVDIGRGWFTGVTRLLDMGLGWFTGVTRLLDMGLGWFTEVTRISPPFRESGAVLLREVLKGLPVFRLRLLMMWRGALEVAGFRLVKWRGALVVAGFRLVSRFPFVNPGVGCAIDADKSCCVWWRETAVWCLNLLVIVVVLVRLWDRREVWFFRPSLLSFVDNAGKVCYRTHSC